ncbi:MAG: glutamate synthase [Elusimicrobia bacterium]|nr:glutamate synthase [Elusimicrobiota bacterium]
MFDPELLINSRTKLQSAPPPLRKAEDEGGCGVLGAIGAVPIAGRHILCSTEKMKNRGNAKGGGICAGWIAEPEKFGVDQATLENNYLLALAFLDPQAEAEVEQAFVTPNYEIHGRGRLKHAANFRDIAGLSVEPPEVNYYFIRVKKTVLDRFIEDNKLEALGREHAEDEFVYQTSYRLNKTYYHSLGDKKAFVLSHAKNLLVLKLVGYAEDCIRYYQLEDFRAHIWIGHQRYPTKGRVWHPGGAHPFIGMHEALVHNGDFANYIRVAKYLRQRKIYPLFLTDTEVSVLLFDLWRRVYRYPLEWTIEAMAPTTERDFIMLPQDKQKLYRELQLAHLKGSPDGPWFFIIARNDPHERAGELIGITDTSMLRPQVFALSLADDRPAIGAIASEKQAIDAFLSSMNQEDSRISRYADLYWNARGASYCDGGAFIYRLKKAGGRIELTCANKFGGAVEPPPLKDFPCVIANPSPVIASEAKQSHKSPLGERPEQMAANPDALPASIENLKNSPPERRDQAIETLTFLIDRRFDTQGLRRARILEMATGALESLLDRIPSKPNETPYCRVNAENWIALSAPALSSGILVLDASGFAMEGPRSTAGALVKAYGLGWKRFIVYRTLGHRFLGCGLGAGSQGVQMDIYGSPGDYLASGLDGARLIVHNNAQDQTAQIMNNGELIVHGDVGQTFMYGAKGGRIFILGNTAGRPLINAVGRPRVIINGTSLDYLAESFMAGDPHQDGGFAVVNGVRIDETGALQDLESPYPGGNLFSLAAGGAIFMRDPEKKLDDDQLNGGRFEKFDGKDWTLIKPMLEENERLFGIKIERLLSHNGESRTPDQMYRKIVPAKTRALALGYD